jgi:C1A family cysteine protease
MPTVGTVIPDHPHQIEKTKVLLSSETYSKGIGAIKGANGETLTEYRFNTAEISAATILPATFTLTYPPVQDQGNFGACVAFAAVYVRNILQYYSQGAVSWSTSVNQFSQEYIYNQAKFGDCSAGTAVQTCLDIMKNQGVCLYATLPYTDNNGCDILPDDTQREEAALYKISGYTLIPNTDTAAIKSALVSGKGVMATYIADDNFVNNTLADWVWNSTTTTTGALPHTLTIIGWDDTKAAWRILNSWGTDWGGEGLGWIGYDITTISNKQAYYTYILDGLPASNTGPTANAGSDSTTITGGTATLNGTGSTDPDGFIKTFLWEQVSGPNSASIVNAGAAVTNITGLITGTYVFKLTVTDDDDSTAVDSVSVTVIAAAIETLSLTKHKIITGRKAVDVLTWSIAFNQNPLNASIEKKTTKGKTVSYQTVYSIVPYTAQGSFTTSSFSSTINNSYRLKVVKTDGTIVYKDSVVI